MLTTILFDVDGTLIDTEFVMINSFKKTLKDEKNLSLSTEDVLYILGIPGRAALKKYIQSADEIEALMKIWDENIQELSHYTKVFEGIPELLAQLKQRKLKLGIVTSGTSEELKDGFGRFGYNDYFDVIVTASDTKRHKPEPDPVLKALDLLQVERTEALYLGDSVYDMRCARSAGVSFALAKWGAKENPEFSKADYALGQPDEVLRLLGE